MYIKRNKMLSEQLIRETTAAGLTFVPSPMEAWPIDNVKIPEETAKKIGEQLGALRYNTNKVKWSLVPIESFEEMVKVLEFGAKKYAAWNWTNGNGLSWSDTLDSLQRHLNAFKAGEDTDPESKLNHLGHMACNILFLLHYYKNKEKFNRDDRNKRV